MSHRLVQGCGKRHGIRHSLRPHRLRDECDVLLLYVLVQGYSVLHERTYVTLVLLFSTLAPAPSAQTTACAAPRISGNSSK